MKKNKFYLSHDNSLTMDMGKLVPFCLIETLPNDSFRISCDSFVRAQPMLAPLMHKVDIKTEFWYVPNRIIWDDFEDFITAGLSGVDTPNFPTIDINPLFTKNPLANYLGLPNVDNNLVVNALPFRAYAEIWNTRYRDEDLDSEVNVSYASGVDTTTNTKLLNRRWQKDYFTTARLSTQRGSEISVPVTEGDVPYNSYLAYDIVVTTLTQSVNPAPLITISPTDGTNGLAVFLTSLQLSKKDVDAGTVIFTGNVQNSTASETVSVTSTNGSSAVLFKNIIPDGAFSADVTEVTFSFRLDFSSTPKSAQNAPYVNNTSVRYYGSGSFSPTVATLTRTDYPPIVNGAYSASMTTNYTLDVRDLRLASGLQRYQERSLRWGNRYEEYLASEFGLSPRDSRIQRPEYLGGSSSVLQISEVLQTAEGTNTGVGTMRGHGVGGLRQRPIRFKSAEHGFIIGLVSICPRAVYTQGLNKFWRKFNRMDYFTKELSTIGMQEVYQSEIFANGQNYDVIFGYQDRDSEYRHIPNRICGEFAGVLDYWNLAREFENPPVLNSSFIEMVPSKRVFAEQTQNSFLVMLRNKIKAYRVVPKYAKNILK